MPKRRPTAKIGPSVLANAERLERQRRKQRRTAAKRRTAPITSHVSDVKPSVHRVYVGYNDEGQPAIHRLIGTTRQWLGDPFGSIPEAIAAARDLNARGEEKLIFSDGVKRGNPNQQYGTYKPYKPTAAERRRMKAEEEELAEAA